MMYLSIVVVGTKTRLLVDDENKAMMQQAGFAEVSYHNLTGGIVALHRGYKF